MSDTKPTPPTPGETLAPEQAAEIAGGDGSCTTTVTLSGAGVTVQSTYNSLGDAISGTYDGLVDGTSHVIETVAGAL